MSFIDYFESIRRRTVNYTQTIPSDRIDWSPKDGEFTCGDIFHHLSAEESLFVGAVVEGRWKYPVMIGLSPLRWIRRLHI